MSSGDEKSGIKMGKASSPIAQRHLILDMDETLLHSFLDHEILNSLRIMTTPKLDSLRHRIYVLRNNYWGITRPGMREFLTYCIANFYTVTIWSAGDEDYVNEFVKKIFRGLPNPDAVMTRQDCEVDDEVYVKPLNKVAKYYQSLGRYDVEMDETNTLIVEDRLSAVIPQDKDNLILIPAYSPSPLPQQLLWEEDSLRVLTRWLKSDVLSEASDVREMKKPSFRKMAVPTNPISFRSFRGPNQAPLARLEDIMKFSKRTPS